MKIKNSILLVFISLFGIYCSSDNNGHNSQYIYIDNNEIVQIENNQNTFSVGESITIVTDIDLEQVTTNNKTVNLSNYDLGQVGQSSYEYVLTLYKATTFGTITAIGQVPLTEDLITSIEGEIEIKDPLGILQVSSIFDGTSYKNKFSILLPEAGTYYLARDPLFLLGGTEDVVRIHSIIADTILYDGYEFVVN